MNKKNLLLMGSIFVLQSTMAQVLQRHNNAYKPDDKIEKQQVEFKDPGSSGKQLTWDFRHLQPINPAYGLHYFIPDSSKMDVVCGREHNSRYYYRLHNDSLWALGFENNTTFMEYTEPELLMRYPFAYGDTLYSTFEGKGIYSNRIALQVKGYTRIHADAEGDLLLPDFETVKRALRTHTRRYYTQTGRDSLEMSIDTYAWYADGNRYPVFESVRTNLIKKARRQGQQGKDTTVFATSFYYPPIVQNTQVESNAPSIMPEQAMGVEAVFTEASYMPNPVVTNLTISYKLTRPARIGFSVHNNAGIPVRQSPARNMPEGYNQTIIPMSNTLTGTYTLYVFVDDMVLQKVVVKK